MNIEQLKHIVKIAHTGSMSLASNELHVTQSALSQSVSRLEKELGLIIFKRSKAGAAATPEGKKVIAKALKALQAIDEMEKLAEHEQHIGNSELDIATFPGLMPIMVKMLAALKKEYPLLRINIEENVSTAIVKDIRAGRIGLGLVAMYEDEVEQAAGVMFDPIVQGKLVVCANRNSRAAKNKTIHPKDLCNYNLVLYHDKFVEDFVADLTLEYGELPILFTTNNAEAIRTSLHEDFAITIGHDFSFKGQHEYLAEGLSLVEIAPFPQRKMVVGWIKTYKKQMSLLYEHCIQKFKHELDNVRI
ncbi:LysR family transcriptional regulator [Paenibacillus sinopodophylli]|uniref:LysR family transcriptional regulator n=1 Tax=Paenibacillus sinopodophylli TaxID=1837342 RepID=UPI001485D2F8|nr:LysR family transcriptional regulator [Paenibacillus sinopodophylli]